MGFVAYTRLTGNDGSQRDFIGRVVLCANTEVTDFYYDNDGSDDAKNWVTEAGKEFAVTQDEGMILINSKLFKDKRESQIAHITFRIYDVFDECVYDNSCPVEMTSHPFYEEDWGIPKGSGEFFIEFPKWML